ncbi:unnamed protein product [Effrenium voratum]|uniref:Uncharacterized protein n=1 Tax=Effrenium voratum TaxID=2562239 RepID=A0AA36HZX8_9DINO|nr:unnamed protein product [Effrenium voratum]
MSPVPEAELRFGVLGLKSLEYNAKEAVTEMPFVGQAFVNVDAYEKLTESLSRVICEHRLQDVASVLLLHFHHHMEEGEILLEKVDEKEAITSPVFMETVAEDPRLVPHSFRLKKVNDSFKWVPTEFVLDTDGQMQQLTDSMLTSDGFMDAMATELLTTGLWTVFGIQTLHRHQVVLKEDEVLVEESTKPWEEEGRISRFWPHPATVIDYSNPTLLKTTWAWMNQKVWVCAGNCSGCKHCSGNQANVNMAGEKAEYQPTDLKKVWVCAGNCSGCKHCSGNQANVNMAGEKVGYPPTDLKKVWVCAGNCSGCKHCSGNQANVNMAGEKVEYQPTDLKKVWVCAGNCSGCKHCSGNQANVNMAGEKVQYQPTDLKKVWVCAGNCSGCKHCSGNQANVNMAGEKVEYQPTDLKKVEV